MTECLSILAGLLTAIPLVVALVRSVSLRVKEKNWQALLSLVLSLMEQAETRLATGSERKEWVLAMVKAQADRINYEYDSERLSALIDEIISMTKTVNTSEEESL